MTPLDVVFISGLFTIGGSTLAWFLARRDKREDRRAAAGTPGAPTVQEIWDRQDMMERAFRSALVLLGEVAEQLPEGVEPVLSRKHIAILAEGNYLPVELERFVTDGRG